MAAYLAVMADEDGDSANQLTVALGHVLRPGGGNRLDMKVFVEMLRAVGLRMRIGPV